MEHIACKTKASQTLFSFGNIPEKCLHFFPLYSVGLGGVRLEGAVKAQDVTPRLGQPTVTLRHCMRSIW